MKALAWCPFQSNLLASGGGTADRCIKFWNTNTGVMLNSIDTHSQVCALQWNKHERELLSSHGRAVQLASSVAVLRHGSSTQCSRAWCSVTLPRATLLNAPAFSA